MSRPSSRASGTLADGSGPGGTPTESPEKALPLSKKADERAQGPMARLASGRADPYLVYFKKNDPECPFNFPLVKKWRIVLIIAFQILQVAGLGASWSPVNAPMAEEFGTSQLVMRIPQAMYLIGFALGPVVLTPLAEDYGRKYTFTASCALLYIFQIPIALAPNYATLVVCRFIGGFVASPIFNSVCNIPDLWRDTDEPVAGFALNTWAFSAEIIVIAPIWSAYIYASLGWRWMWGISGLVGIASTVVFFFAVPETRHTVLLEQRAKRMRLKTGDERWFAESERQGRRKIGQVLQETLYRPVFMLLTEPIVNLTAAYDGLNYAIIYLAIEGVPLIMTRHDIEEPEVNLLFISIVVGYLLGIAAYPIQLRLARNLNMRKDADVPEGKLYWSFFAAIVFPVSLYLFAWLSLPRFHWFGGMVPLALFGMASHIIFIAISDYTVKAYGHLASSAVTGQSFAREFISAGMIIAGQRFFESIGYPEATTILAAIATAMAPIVFVFFWKGPQIRARSSFSQMIIEGQRRDAARAALEEEEEEE